MHIVAPVTTRPKPIASVASGTNYNKVLGSFHWAARLLVSTVLTNGALQLCSGYSVLLLKVQSQERYNHIRKSDGTATFIRSSTQFRRIMFVGFTRFSLFQPGAPHWVATRRLHEQEYRKNLFNPERLDMRADIFFNMSLPQLALAAQNHHIRHVISYSDLLPEKYLQALREANEQYEFVVLDECAPNEPPITSAELLGPLARTNGGFQFAEYRLDDDDIVSSDYFDRLNAFLHPSFQGMYVSFGTGLAALYVDGDLYYARRSLQRLIAIGLAKICRIEDDETITGPRHIRHSMSDVAAPVVLDSRELAYVWVRHDEQDSFTDTRSESKTDKLETIRRQMSKFPAAENLSEIQTHFPAISSRIHISKAPGVTRTVIVPKTTEVPSQGLETNFGSVQGHTDLSVRIRTDRTRVHRNVLASFNLVDPDGNSASREDWEDKLKAIGVRFSNSRRVGFYRYFDTKDGVTNAEMTLKWPKGLALQGVKFLKYRDPDASVHIEQATLSHFQ